MAGTASGITTFILGREVDGNRETRTFLDGEAYDLDYAYAEVYSDGDTSFPHVVDA